MILNETRNAIVCKRTYNRVLENAFRSRAIHEFVELHFVVGYFLPFFFFLVKKVEVLLKKKKNLNFISI